MINDLKVTFDIKNKKNKIINKLLNVTFRISFEKKFEIFEKFFFRFNNLTIFFNLFDILKIKYLKNKINNKIKYKITHFKNCNN